MAAAGCSIDLSDWSAVIDGMLLISKRSAQTATSPFVAGSRCRARRGQHARQGCWRAKEYLLSKFRLSHCSPADGFLFGCGCLVFANRSISCLQLSICVFHLRALRRVAIDRLSNGQKTAKSNREAIVIVVGLISPFADLGEPQTTTTTMN